jgi:hypothetical protein
MGTTLQAAKKTGIDGEIIGERPSGAKALVDFKRFSARLKSCPDASRCIDEKLQKVSLKGTGFSPYIQPAPKNGL